MEISLEVGEGDVEGWDVGASCQSVFHSGRLTAVVLILCMWALVGRAYSSHAAGIWRPFLTKADILLRAAATAKCGTLVPVLVFELIETPCACDTSTHRPGMAALHLPLSTSSTGGTLPLPSAAKTVVSSSRHRRLVISAATQSSNAASPHRYSCKTRLLLGGKGS